VAAGVIGKKRFIYDLWGDTVNTASRMQSACEPGKVNIGGNTFVHVGQSYSRSPLGKIEAKNRRMVDMYFVNR